MTPALLPPWYLRKLLFLLYVIEVLFRLLPADIYLLPQWRDRLNQKSKSTSRLHHPQNRISMQLAGLIYLFNNYTWFVLMCTFPPNPRKHFNLDIVRLRVYPHLLDIVWQVTCRNIFYLPVCDDLFWTSILQDHVNGKVWVERSSVTKAWAETWTKICCFISERRLSFVQTLW